MNGIALPPTIKSPINKAGVALLAYPVASSLASSCCGLGDLPYRITPCLQIERNTRSRTRARGISTSSCKHLPPGSPFQKHPATLLGWWALKLLRSAFVLCHSSSSFSRSPLPSRSAARHPHRQFRRRCASFLHRLLSSFQVAKLPSGYLRHTPPRLSLRATSTRVCPVPAPNSRRPRPSR